MWNDKDAFTLKIRDKWQLFTLHFFFKGKDLAYYLQNTVRTHVIVEMWRIGTLSKLNNSLNV